MTAFYETHYGGDMTGSTLPDSSTVYIFRSIWPRKEGSKDWREDWASLPLHGVDPPGSVPDKSEIRVYCGFGMTQKASRDNSV
jgi:hypothetical protein